MASSPGNVFDPSANLTSEEFRASDTARLETVPNSEGPAEAAMSLAADDNHLGHPRFARMLGHVGDFPDLGSLRLSFLFADLAFSILSLLLVSYVRAIFSFLPAHWGGLLARRPYRGSSDEFLAFLILYITLTLLTCHSVGLYDTREPRPLLDRGSSLLKAIGFSTALLVIFSRLSGFAALSPLAVTCTGLLNVGGFTAWRIWHRELVRHKTVTRKQVRNLLIIGNNTLAHRIAESIADNAHNGYAVVGLVRTNGRSDTKYDLQSKVRDLGDVSDLSRIARAHFVDEILIIPPFERDMVRRVLTKARRNRLDVNVVPELYEEICRSSLMDHVGEIPVMSLHREPIPANKLLVKRAIDIFLASILLILTSPLFLVIAIAIKLTSNGPAIYCARRVGKKGHKFLFYKFRTMIVGADQHKASLRSKNQRSGPFFKIKDDPRITPVGRVLRRFSLDELPQLWNVLKGDMSLVGPRPHPLDDYEQYKLEDLRRLDVLPGITGLWQVSSRKDPAFERNLALDLEYIERWSLWQDFVIMLKTVPAVLGAQGE